MKTAVEVVNHLNKTGENVYDVSERLEFGRTTLRNRLMRLGYQENREGKWVYTGDPDKEPVDQDIVSRKRMATSKAARRKSQELNISKDLFIHQALMQINLADKGVRTTITVQPKYIDEMKELAANTRLRLSDLYTLAIHELLEKYHSN